MRLMNQFLLGLFVISSMSPVFSVASDYEAYVQKMYIAYYGRPGDEAGIDFWVWKLSEQNGHMADIIEAFGSSAEYTERFATLSHAEFINNIYLSLLGRDADFEGLIFYTEKLDLGEMTLSSIALNVANGVPVGSNDECIINNRVQVASKFTQNLRITGASYDGQRSIEDAATFITAVDCSGESVSTVIEKIECYFISDCGLLPYPPGEEGNVLVYIYNGKTQCFEDGLTPGESAENLFAQGLDVISTQCGYETGRAYASVCGGVTGEIISHEIRPESLEDASLFAYNSIAELVDEVAGLGYVLNDCEAL